MSTVDNSHVIIVLDDSNYDKDGCCCSKNRIILLRIHTTYLAPHERFAQKCMQYNMWCLI